MTSSSRSFGVEWSAALLIAFLLTGCGPNDGLQELAEGRSAFEAGDAKKAEKLLLKSETLAPNNVDTLVSLTQVLLKRGALAEAKQRMEHAEELAPGDTDVRLLGAQVAWHAKDYAKAERLFQGLADDAQLESEVRAEGWTGLGIVQMTCEEHDLARVSFLRAIRMDRRCASARYHLGQLYRFAPFDYPEAALEQFEAFVHLAGELSSPRVQKTQLTIIPGLKETIARTAMERPGAAQRNSAASMAALSKADAAWKKNQFKSARLAYQEAFTADPLSYPAALGLAKCELKVDGSVAGQKKALEGYRTACSLRPSAVTTLLEAGQLAEKLSQPVQARSIYSRAVAANPASLDALDGLIRSLRKANAERKVVQAYQLYRDSLPKAKKR